MLGSLKDNLLIVSNRSKFFKKWDLKYMKKMKRLSKFAKNKLPLGQATLLITAIVEIIDFIYMH